MENSRILVVDLFAGPGGLGEGFASCKCPEEGSYPFKIAVSVEKDAGAHKTLTTRAFFRQIRSNQDALQDYYRYVRGELTREELFSAYPEQAEHAKEETLSGPKTLGEENEVIHQRIRELKEQHDGPVVVIGGPPCQAYSLAGRSRNAGIADYKAEEDNRHFLYKEYLEVIALAQPEVFVMENVRGILSAKINGELIFPQILKDLRQPGQVTTEYRCEYGYRIFSLVQEAQNPLDPDYSNTSDFLIKAEEYGVPQARHRVILLGVRDDVQVVPETLQNALRQVTVGQVIGDLPELRSGFSKRKDDTSDWEAVVTKHALRLETILGFRFTSEQIAQLDLTPYVGLPRLSHRYSNKDIRTQLPDTLQYWLFDDELDFVANHQTRGHIEPDLLRYAFCAAFTSLEGRSPKSVDFPDALAPEHANWHTGKHADRFRTQYRDRYSTTVTSHISKDGHYFIHYDPKQCRSLTVREAARLQTFPDNYLFEGNRTQQYVQVGNAVPPFLAQQIGRVVMGLLLNRNE